MVDKMDGFEFIQSSCKQGSIFRASQARNSESSSNAAKAGQHPTFHSRLQSRIHHSFRGGYDCIIDMTAVLPMQSAHVLMSDVLPIPRCLQTPRNKNPHLEPSTRSPLTRILVTKLATAISEPCAVRWMILDITFSLGQQRPYRFNPQS